MNHAQPLSYIPKFPDIACESILFNDLLCSCGQNRHFITKLITVILKICLLYTSTNGELCDRISNEIENRGSQHIYRFRIRGMRDPDIEFDLEQLTVRYRIAEIIDDSEPQYDFSALFAEHSSDMIGFYIQALQKEDMSPVEKKACLLYTSRCV